MNVDAGFFNALWTDRPTDDGDMAQFWTQRAASYEAHTQRAEAAEHRRILVARLVSRAGLNAGSAVLDIGCGPGGNALALAAHAGRVEACDIAPGMLDAARQRAGERGAGNVAFHELDWTKADIDALGWRGAFDLTLASKTPAISDLAGLDAMTATSRGICCLVTHAALRHSLWDRLVPPTPEGEERGRRRNPFWCAFNILWLQGRLPETEYFERAWEADTPLEDAEIIALRRFRHSHGPDGERDERIRRGLRDAARNGMVHERVRSIIVLMTWKGGASPAMQNI